MDVALHAKVCRVNDLVGSRVGKDSLGVNTGLVGEGAETSHVVVEGDVDLNGGSDEILDGLELVQVVLALDVLAISCKHASNETTKWRDTIALADSKNGGVNVSGTGLQGAVRVGNGTPGVVVEVSLNVTADNATKGAPKCLLAMIITADSRVSYTRS